MSKLFLHTRIQASPVFVRSMTCRMKAKTQSVIQQLVVSEVVTLNTRKKEKLPSRRTQNLQKSHTGTLWSVLEKLMTT